MMEAECKKPITVLCNVSIDSVKMNINTYGAPAHAQTHQTPLTQRVDRARGMISDPCLRYYFPFSVSPSHSSDIFGLIVNIRAESFANGCLFHATLIRYKSSCPPLGLITKWLIKTGFCLLSNKPPTIASKCLVFSFIAGPLGQSKTGIADRREGEDDRITQPSVKNEKRGQILMAVVCPARRIQLVY